MENKFKIVFTVSLTDITKKGFHIDSKLEADIKGEYDLNLLCIISHEITSEFVLKINRSIADAYDSSRSLQ